VRRPEPHGPGNTNETATLHPGCTKREIEPRSAGIGYVAEAIRSPGAVKPHVHRGTCIGDDASRWFFQTISTMVIERGSFWGWR
jgi:hypothetical protein